MIKQIRTKIASWLSPRQTESQPTSTTRVIIHNRTLPGTGYGSGPKSPHGMSRPSASINIHDHSTIRQRARDMMYDSMECRALVESQVDTNAGDGLRPKSVPIVSLLGITPEEGEAWGEKADEIYDLWAKSKKSHRCRVNNFYQNTRLYEFFKQRDNDIFVRLFYDRDKDQTNPLSIDFIDPNQIRGFGYTSTYANSAYDDGIIRDSKGREIGYKIWTFDSITGKYIESTIPAKGEKSGRFFMIHGFNPEYAGQGRGYSKLTHLLQELENLTDYKFSVLQKAINQSSFIGVTENDQQDASQPLEGRVAGPRSEYGVSPDAADDNGDGTSADPIVNWDANPEATIRQPGSIMIGNLRRGDKMKYLQDTSPGPNYETFCNNVFSYIAASEGTSIEFVRKIFSQNFSATRGILILIWRRATIERNDTASDFLDPIREMLLSEEIAAGRLQAPGWSDPIMRAAWLNCEWAGFPMPNIDPQKSAAADQLYMQMGAQTPDDVARNFNGSSGKANRIKNKRQFAELPVYPFPQAPIVVTPDNQDGNNQNNTG